jgi:hypothetical protein
MVWEEDATGFREFTGAFLGIGLTGVMGTLVTTRKVVPEQHVFNSVIDAHVHVGRCTQQRTAILNECFTSNFLNHHV